MDSNYKGNTIGFHINAHSVQNIQRSVSKNSQHGLKINPVRLFINQILGVVLVFGVAWVGLSLFFYGIVWILYKITVSI